MEGVEVRIPEQDGEVVKILQRTGGTVVVVVVVTGELGRTEVERLGIFRRKRMAGMRTKSTTNTTMKNTMIMTTVGGMNRNIKNTTATAIGEELPTIKTKTRVKANTRLR